MDRNGKSSVQHEGRIQLHAQSKNNGSEIVNNQEQTRKQEDSDDGTLTRGTLL